ncbi:hypothetical protein DYB36_008579 [Aphanomyces astaci]|uniref:Ion transport domain-containing protein n=1 Tax=Aphanomyces astaci TaxID=112090 RepID=A0A396ZZK0_APHAT|nr:hypothetical protein DYB36_008579 [Aphanomyces astaci]
MEQPTMRLIMRKASGDDEHSQLSRSSTDTPLMTRRAMNPPPPHGRRQATCQPKVPSRKYWPDLVLASAHLKATSKFRWFWDIYTMLLLCYTAVAVPFEIAFVQQDDVDALFIFDRCVDLSFCIDMVFNFITPYWDPHANAMVEELPLIIKQYLTIFRILRILRVIKLVRVFRASRIFSRWQAQLNIPMAIFKLAGHLATILLLAHWLGCLWGGVVHFEYHTDAQGNKLSWMSVYGIDNKGMQTQYVTSLYWAVVTILTIGYGDIPVVTLEEKGIAIVCMIAGCGTYSFGTV